MTAVLDRRGAHLHGDLGDVACVRRSIGDWLRQWGLSRLVDDVELVASELITNAILHAGGEIDVVLERRDGGVRIVVRDSQPNLVPSRRILPPIGGLGDLELERFARTVLETTTTGRGLLLVEAFSDAWGADIAPTSKQVWAEVGTGRPAASDPARPSTGGVAGVAVQVMSVPVRLVLLSAANLDDLVRELQTTDFDTEAPATLADLGERLVQETSSLREPLRLAARAALRQRARRVDVDLDVPASQADALRRFVSLTDPVSELCRAGVLLSEAPTDEVTTFRRWLVNEVDRQVQGGAPVACPFPD